VSATFDELSSAKHDIVARTIIEALAGAGVLAGLAAAIYLLAPLGS